MIKIGRQFLTQSVSLSGLMRPGMKKSLCRILFILFAMTFIFVKKAHAQVIVQAQISQDKVGINQAFELELSVTTTSQADIGKPTPPQMKEVEVQGSNQRTQISTRMQAGANGMEYVTQKTVQYNYVLVPTKLGKSVIGSFEVEVDGKKYKTSPIQIEVSQSMQGKPQLKQGQNRRGQPSPFDEEQDPFMQMDRMEEEMFNQLLRRRGMQNPLRQEDEPAFQGNEKEPQFRSMPKNNDEAFFIQVEVDKTEVYEGEQILVSWYLLTRGQLESLDRTKFPDLKGFWKEIIEEVPAIQFYQEVINGVPFKKAMLARHALFPFKAGETFIDEFKIKSKVRLPQQGWGLNTKSYEFTKSSQRVKISVKPLPSEGRPANFTGAVGKFQIKSNIQGSEPIAHQPINLKIRFEGSGNAKGLELPPIVWPEGSELFEVKSDSKFLKNGQSFKEFDVILIPRKEGSLTIPAIEASFFNPETGKYYTEKSEVIPLQVQPGNPQNNENTYRMGKKAEGVKEVHKQTLPDPIQDLKGFDRRDFPMGIIWMGIYLLILVFFISYSVLSFGWWNQKRSFKKELQRKINQIEIKWDKSSTKQIYVEVTNLFYFALGVLAGEAGGTQEMTKLMDKMPSSMRRQYGKELIELFEYFQTLSFAPDHVIAEVEKNSDVKKQFEKVKVLLSLCAEARQNKT